MLIRVSGGVGGVAEYLRLGRKAGRKATRDDLDRRVVLQGNLSATDRLIRSISRKGERYLHITLSFREDSMLPELLRKISERFRAFLMAAFADDEYCYYAEAHLPRIKSYINQVDGEFVQRKPHIHVVVPSINLVSGQRLDPLGNVRHAERYYDAFQEAINGEFGLASPKDYRSVSLAGGSITVSRLKGDVFSGSVGRQLKSHVLQQVLDQNVTDWSDFMRLLGQIGPTRVRNPKKPNRYAHVIPEGAARGVNLRDYVFSPGFISLPSAEKQMRLNAKPDDGYVEKAKGHPLPIEHESTLRAWQRRRAHEVRWINSGHRKLWQAYKDADDQCKQAILEERKSRWIRLHRQSGPAAAESPSYAAKSRLGLVAVSVNTNQHDDRLSAASPVFVPILPDAVNATLSHGPQGIRWRDTRIGQLAYEHAQRLLELEDSQLPSVEDAKRHLSGQRLLVALAQSHGLLPEKYMAFVDENGIPRIQCGNRKLNLADFLTKEVHLEWVQARDLLVDMYRAQLRQDSESETESPEVVDPSQELSTPVTAESEQAMHGDTDQIDYLPDEAADGLQLPSDPIGAPIPATDLDEALLDEDPEMLSGAQSLPSEQPDELTPESGADDSRVSTLPDTPPPNFTPMMTAPMSISAPLDPAIPAEARHSTLTKDEIEEQVGAHLVDQHGEPTVWFDGEQIYAGPWEDESVLQKLIELAFDIFGPDLTLHGSDEFHAAVGRMAAEMNLDMSFTDEIAAECFEARRAELDQGQVPGM